MQSKKDSEWARGADICRVTEVTCFVQSWEEEAEWVVAYNFFLRGSGGGGTDLISLVISDRTWGNSMNLH